MLVLSIIVCIAMNLNCNFWIYEGLLITLLFTTASFIYYRLGYGM